MWCVLHLVLCFFDEKSDNHEGGIADWWSRYELKIDGKFPGTHMYTTKATTHTAQPCGSVLMKLLLVVSLWLGGGF